MLSIVPTPIGNLEDITFRALETLKVADLIACEDTRHTLKLLRHFGIEKTLMSYHLHNREAASEKILSYLKEGRHVALVTDAGMPGIQDPGSLIIERAIAQGLEVDVLPGPTAFVNALVGSGLPTEHFFFHGFLPRKEQARQRVFEDLSRLDATLIFYEAPHRLLACLRDLEMTLPERRVVVARELTKTYETFHRGYAGELLRFFEDEGVRGEIVLLVEGAPPPEETDYEDLPVRDHILSFMEMGLSKKEAIKKVAKLRGVQKNEIYRESHDL